MATGTEWTPERKERLRVLWADPALSCSEIGRRMGVSKCAITGARARQGLPERGSPLPPAGSGARPNQYKTALRRLPGNVATLLNMGSTPVAKLEPPPLPRGTCQFIAGDVRQRGWSFCGAPSSKPGSSWCAVHRRVVFHPRQASRVEVE